MLNYYTNKNITIIVVFLSIIALVLINYLFNFSQKYQKEKNITQGKIVETIKDETQKISNKEIMQQIQMSEEMNQELNDTQEWKIIIPVIGIEAQIKQGVSQEILANYVGHFEETQLENGNIGLAAHNRGNNPSYFKEIKTLQKKDKIIYKIGTKIKEYEVISVNKIEETNWNYLQPTQDNRITLITCVENEPEYRICVQAIEKY